MTQTFPDGGAFRFEIPSVEGPKPLEAVLSAANTYGVPLHRVSQGSGDAMLDDHHITDMVSICREAAVELCLFLGPRGNWDIGGSAFRPGSVPPLNVSGKSHLQFSIDDALRAIELGVPCLLVGDTGVLWTLHEMRVRGEIPPDIRLKVSALAGPSNPASVSVMEKLGADSINVPGGLTVDQLAELRAASGAAFDIYLESPANLGGFVRVHEAADIVRRVGPVYLKFGLRNAPDIYPVGLHLAGPAVTLAEERVRRAHLVLEALTRAGLRDRMSRAGSQSMPKPKRFDATSPTQHVA
ncbi:conserved hypothetical protein [Mesorhizobium sp. SOD10]|nr:conserved hypothetical protein [Mesorhizobium sp. SOD10]